MEKHQNLIVNIKDLYFDPNNYRLRSNPKFTHVNESSLFKPAIQKRTMMLITGKGNIQIRDLIDSFKSNGYLKVDNILVKKHKNGYLVIEGNRRLAALKVLKEEYETGFEIDKFNPNIIKDGDGYGVEVVLYDYDNDNEYKILMGLKHVSGNKKWEKYNEGKLVYELSTSGNDDSTDISKKIGMKKREVEEHLRGFYAIEIFINAIANEDFGDEFNPHDKFMIFVETMNKPKMRDWLGWDEKLKKFKRIKNRNRFFEWITPRFETDDETDLEILYPPIIVNHKQVRDLVEIIDDEETLEIMEEKRNFDLALDQNREFTSKMFSRIIAEVENKMRNVKIGGSLILSKKDKLSLNNIITIAQKFLSKIE